MSLICTFEVEIGLQDGNLGRIFLLADREAFICAPKYNCACKKIISSWGYFKNELKKRKVAWIKICQLSSVNSNDLSDCLGNEWEREPIISADTWLCVINLWIWSCYLHRLNNFWQEIAQWLFKKKVLSHYFEFCRLGTNQVVSQEARQS